MPFIDLKPLFLFVHPDLARLWINFNLYTLFTFSLVKQHKTALHILFEPFDKIRLIENKIQN